MRHIFVNLKRFDVTPELGGVNRLSEPASWGMAVVEGVREVARAHSQEAEFAVFLPEAQLVGALRAAEGWPVGVGCQGVHVADTAPGGNFGAFTTLRPAHAMTQLGCGWVIVGHCEERMWLRQVMGEAGAEGPEVEAAVSRTLSREVARAQEAGMRVLFCLGERDFEQDSWERVLSTQLEAGLDGADVSGVRVAYEPVWSIGPGKTPADAPYIAKVARLLKATLPGVDVVYGGGLKQDNAEMLAGVSEVDGSLVALTRFTGEIGFYPDEFARIVELYLGK